MTATELINTRADASKDNMGLQTFKGDKVRKSDVIVAKNDLNENELKSLNRIVTMYLDYAEGQAERQQPMYMSDWKEKLNAFLKFNDREILENAGRIKKEVADSLALKEYEVFNQKRISNEKHDDFLEFIKEDDIK